MILGQSLKVKLKKNLKMKRFWRKSVNSVINKVIHIYIFDIIVYDIKNITGAVILLGSLAYSFLLFSLFPKIYKVLFLIIKNYLIVY